MTEAIVFAIATAAVICITKRYGTPSLYRTAWAMAGNMVAVWAAQFVSGSYTPWLAFIIVDVITAYIVLAHPATRTQALIGAVYVAQIIAHIAFGAAQSKNCGSVYLDLLAFGGVCQLLILATGAINGRRGRMVDAWRGGVVPARDTAADMARMDDRP